MGTWNPWVLGSSEPTPEEPLRRGEDPNSGVQGEHCTLRYWSTSYIHPGPTRTTRAPCHCVALRALLRGRDECPSSEGRTKPPLRRAFISPCLRSWLSPLKPPPPHLTVFCCGWPRLPRPLFSALLTTSETLLANVHVDALRLRAPSPDKFMDVCDMRFCSPAT